MRGLALIVLLPISVLLSCSKYDDNEGLSLQSKKNRLTQEWAADYYEVNGIEIPNSNYAMNVAFEDDGAYTYTFSFLDNSGNFTTNSTLGEWEFNSDKTSILLKATGTTSTREWKVRRLERDHLWVRVDIPESQASLYVEFSSE